MVPSFGWDTMIHQRRDPLPEPATLICVDGNSSVRQTPVAQWQSNGLLIGP